MNNPRKTVRATVSVNKQQREKHFAVGTPKREIDAWKKTERAKLEKRYPAASRLAKSTPASGTVAADIKYGYLPLVGHLKANRRAEISHWIPFIGDRGRHTIDQRDVLRARSAWLTAGVRHNTIANRISALRDFYRKLDGPTAPTPADKIPQLPKQKHIVPRVNYPAIVQRVADTLAASPRKHAQADRARLMVLASTGKRPCELERAEPEDVSLDYRIWMVRDAKGGESAGLWLNDEMLAAWEAFIDANAWGVFPEHYQRRLRDAGWPAGLRPYNVRHATWRESTERGNSLEQSQQCSGHKRTATLRIHYVGVVNSEIQRVSESLNGRFGWTPRTTRSTAPDPESRILEVAPPSPKGVHP